VSAVAPAAADDLARARGQVRAIACGTRNESVSRMRWLLIVAACASGARAEHSKEPDAIIRRNIFCSGCSVAGPGGVRASPLELELVSTMVCPRDQRWSMAVLREKIPRGEARLYRAGAELAGATLIKVVNRRVYFSRDGRVELLELAGGESRPVEPPSDGLRCAAGRCSVPRALVEQLLRDPTVLAADARALPALRQGQPIGFQLAFVRPDSIFARLGLERGDTLRAINGRSIATVGQLMEAWPELRRASRLTLQLDRAGRSQTIDLAILDR
jgi:general secretion pathway protein C